MTSSALAPSRVRDRRARLKICGLTRLEDVDAALELGVDFIGLNFYEPSPRFVDVETARALRERIGDRATVVGVFVNLPLERVLDIEEAVGLDLLQFHGDEALDEAMKDVADRSLKAFKGSLLAEASDSSLHRDHLFESYSSFWGWLFDAPHDTLYGGSGRSWRYGDLAALTSDVSDADLPKLFVAGGINPDNVADVVRQVPDLYAIDVCSGVESQPGVKDPTLMRELVMRLETLETHHGEASS